VPKTGKIAEKYYILQYLTRKPMVCSYSVK
jgi:hypothetical protein